MHLSQETMPHYEDSNRELEIFYENARLIQLQLDECDNDEPVAALRDSVIDELNNMYPYTDQPVIVRGEGILPTVDDDRNIDGAGWSETDLGGGMHEGFHIIGLTSETSEAYKLMHKIRVGTTISDPFPVVHTTSAIYSFMDMDAIVIPLLEIEKQFSPCLDTDVNVQQKLDEIYERSLGLVSLLRSTEFRRLSRKQQFKRVDNYLIEADNAAEVKDLTMMIEPEYAYAPIVEGRTRMFVPLNVGNVVLTGVCVGLDSIEAARLNGKAIRRDQDLGDKEAGICIVIDPDNDTKTGLNLNANQVLYIPTANQSFDIALFRD